MEYLKMNFKELLAFGLVTASWIGMFITIKFKTNYFILVITTFKAKVTKKKN